MIQFLVFCFACRQFWLEVSSNGEDLNIKKGMNNWKKAGEKLDKHALSTAHSFSMSKWIEYRTPTQAVTVLLSESHKQLMEDNWDSMKAILDILLYLSKQGLPIIYGESDISGNKGNFLELCDI